MRPRSDRRPPRARSNRPPRVEPLENRDLLAILPSGFDQSTLVAGLSRPTAMEFAPDGRLFVAEQAGTLRRVDTGTIAAVPTLALAVDDAGERGLLGLAFDPNDPAVTFVYVYYTTPQGGTHNRVSRFRLVGDRADPASEQILVELDALDPRLTNHNAGALDFGADGKLYIATGDNNRSEVAQGLDTRLGKILRYNPDGSIPADNPFFNVATGENRAIWALGLRNPFSMAIQPGTGRIHLNDVGGALFEEINIGEAGANYGWPAAEGPSGDPRFRGPLFSYPHGPGNESGFSIAGGAFYNVAAAAARFPAEYAGQYFFGDFVNRWIRQLDPETGAVAPFGAELAFGLVDLDVGPDGRLYYLARNTSRADGAVHRIDFTAAPTPPPPPPPAPAPDPADPIFVGTLYRDLLGRSPDPGEVAGWVAILRGVASRGAVTEAFLAAPEYRSRQVDAIYREHLGRPAEPAALAFWGGALAGGGSTDDVLAAVLASPEFAAGAGGRPAQVVSRLYRSTIGREPRPGERNAALRQLRRGDSVGLARGLIRRDEARLRSIDRDFATFLRRPAGAADRAAFLNFYRAGAAPELVRRLVLLGPEYQALAGAGPV